MKKLFSALLASLLIMSSLSFSAFNAFAAGGEIIMQASELQGVLQSNGIKAAAKVSLVSGEDAPTALLPQSLTQTPARTEIPFTAPSVL